MKYALSTEQLLPRLTMHAGLMKSHIDFDDMKSLKEEALLFIEGVTMWEETERGRKQSK